MEQKPAVTLWVTWVLPLALITLPGLCHALAAFEVRYNLTSMSISGEKMNGEPYLTFSPRGLYSCAVECKRRTKCKSVNFHLESLTCELFEIDSESPSAQIKSAPGYRFTDMSSWPNNMTGPCDQHSCTETEKCVTDASNQALCISMECGDPPQVDNAQVSGTTSKQKGQSVSYTCDPGYVTDGDLQSTCRTDGQWSPLQGACISCDPAPDLPHATRTNNPTSPGSTAFYTCNTGVLRDGPAELTCGQDAIWPDATFTCVGFETSVSGNSGTLLCRNYPGTYINNDDVTYTVTLDQAGPQTVSVSLQYNIESHTSCSYDYVMVDGQKYCGQSSATKTFSVTGTTFTVAWHTDGSVTKPSGFILDYHVV